MEMATYSGRTVIDTTSNEENELSMLDMPYRAMLVMYYISART
jgi:hypothetical protein